MTLLDILNLPFIQRALLAGIFVAIACAILGVFLVLRKMSLIGDGLAHISFAGIALGLILGISPTLVILPLALLGAGLIWKISVKTKVYGDAAIGIISVVGIALGVTLASSTKTFNLDLFSYLFGSILTVSNLDVLLAILLAVFMLAILGYFYWDLFALTFDPEFSQLTGKKSDRTEIILLIGTALTVALTVKIVGVMLVSALLILPAVSALQFSRSFKQTLLAAVAISVSAIILGILAAAIFNLAAGAAIVLVNAGIFLITLLLKRLKLI